VALGAQFRTKRAATSSLSERADGRVPRRLRQDSGRKLTVLLVRVPELEKLFRTDRSSRRKDNVLVEVQSAAGEKLYLDHGIFGVD